MRAFFVSVCAAHVISAPPVAILAFNELVTFPVSNHLDDM